jgi:hypothetical protein
MATRRSAVMRTICCGFWVLRFLNRIHVDISPSSFSLYCRLHHWFSSCVNINPFKSTHRTVQSEPEEQNMGNFPSIALVSERRLMQSYIRCTGTLKITLFSAFFISVTLMSLDTALSLQRWSDLRYLSTKSKKSLSFILFSATDIEKGLMLKVSV